MRKKRNRRFAVDLNDALMLLQRYTSREEALDALTEKAYFAYPAPDLIDHVRSFLRHPIYYIRYYGLNLAKRKVKP